jgi:hypothetical protein
VSRGAGADEPPVDPELRRLRSEVAAADERLAAAAAGRLARRGAAAFGFAAAGAAAMLSGAYGRVPLCSLDAALAGWFFVSLAVALCAFQAFAELARVNARLSLCGARGGRGSRPDRLSRRGERVVMREYADARRGGDELREAWALAELAVGGSPASIERARRLRARGAPGKRG